MEEEYNALIGLSITKFLAENALREAQVRDDCIYRIYYNNEIINLDMEIPGNILQQQVESLPKLIGVRLKDDFEAELSDLEQSALYLDSSMCATFMKDNFLKGRYKEALVCAERIIQDSAILKAYGESIDTSILNCQIEMAEQVKQKAHICWENPDSAGLIMAMEKAHEDGNLHMYKKIRSQLSIDPLK
jgi:hypothetical protein